MHDMADWDTIVWTTRIHFNVACMYQRSPARLHLDLPLVHSQDQLPALSCSMQLRIRLCGTGGGRNLRNPRSSSLVRAPRHVSHNQPVPDTYACVAA